MSNKITLFFVIFLTSFSTLAYSNDIERAKNFAERGEHQKALQIYKLSAEEGNPQAQIQLGIMYKLGCGTSRDYVLAAKWFNVAAEQGYKGGIEYKNIMENRMTRKQVTEARKLAEEWLQEHSQS